MSNPCLARPQNDLRERKEYVEIDHHTTNENDRKENQATRGQFIRRVGKLTLVGLGISLMPAASAFATNQCCYNECRTDCPSGRRPYLCSDSCSGNSCCVCLEEQANCVTFPCACGP